MIDLGETTSTPRLEWALPRLLKFGAGLALLVATPIFVAWYLMPWRAAHHIGDEMLALHVSPLPVRDATRSTLDPARIHTFEYSFQAPWGRVDARKDLNHATVLLWDAGPVVMAYEPALMSASHDLRTPEKAPADMFQRVLVNHGYNRMAEELKATPEAIHWWDRSGSTRMAFLLGMKEMELERGTVTYSIENDEMPDSNSTTSPCLPSKLRWCCLT